MKRLAILGSTGSIGTSTLQVVAADPGRYDVVALVAGRNLDLLEQQVAAFRPELVCTADEETASEAKKRFGSGCRVVHGPDGQNIAATLPELDMVVCGLVGAMGLRSAWAALDKGIDLALANKEALVVGGQAMIDTASARGARILPVDSEHNAIHQCLRGEKPEEVRRLWLTASGGPFRETPARELAKVTREQALRHPTWSMGDKITIDSATLMNKGLEVIEARWLFDVMPENIRVVVHPQSVIHSMIELVDGSFKAQLGGTDMRHPIQYALTWPQRTESSLPPFDPVKAGTLTFHEPDTDRFPCLDLAFQALRSGSAATAALNAANEVAVAAFLKGEAGFSSIPEIIRSALDRHAGQDGNSIEQCLEIDRQARLTAASAVRSMAGSC